jgi:isochorismate synthase
VALIERPMPDAVSLAALGTAFEVVATAGGAATVDARGHVIDSEAGPRLAAALTLWRRLARDLDPPERGLPATGLVAFAGFAFRPDRDPGGAWSGFPSVLVRVPALAVTRVRGRTFAAAAEPGAEALLDLPAGYRGPAARSVATESQRPPEDWMSAVGEAAARLDTGEAEKVVIAREVIARGDGAITAGFVARALRASFPSCYTFAVTGADGTAFVGASPELLIRRLGRAATSQPMAGSVRRGRDEDEDAELAGCLLASAKDNAEHAVVPRWVAAKLEPISETVEVSRPDVVRFTNIQHLTSTIRARLNDPAPTALELAASLHPTPAIGGFPIEPALGLIDELEQMERGWYAGAVGWLDGRGDGEFTVALRCGLLWEDGARLYAGVGVMPASNPAAELDETEVKLRAMLSALIG